MPSPIDGGVVLITGASSGIGREIARQIASRAEAVALVARRKDRLEELRDELKKQSPNLYVAIYACDVTKADERDAMIKAVEAEAGPVDVLINNAGIGDLGVYDQAEWSKISQMIELNVTALAYLTHRLVRGMVKRGRGGILNISSGFGLAWSPGMAAYAGTKHFVTAFTEGLRLDLLGTGVVVTQVCPGPVATEFADNVGNFTGMDVPKIVEISPARCARVAIRAFDRRRALVVPGILIRFIIFLGVWTPRWFLRLFFAPAARLLRKKQLAALSERSPGAGAK